MTYDEAQLRAYLAGEFSPQAAQALEAQLEQDRDLEDRLFALDMDSAAPLREVMSEIPQDPRITSLAGALPEVQEQIGRSGVMSWARVAAAVVVAFGLGAMLFGNRGATAPSSWQEQVAIYQALYVSETVAPLEFSAEEIAAQVAKSSAILGADLPINVVSSLEGLTLKRAQVLGFEGAPLIQLAYVSPEGTPVALCAVRLDGSTDKATTFETLAGLEAAHWSRDGYGFMLVGDLSKEQIEDLATGLQRQL